jgi:hypothetical protein
MFKIIETGLKEVVRALERAEKEIQFATAKALTKSAQDVQAAVIDKLPEQFTLRTGWYKPNTPYGFKIRMATKQDLEAVVYTKAPWMLLHEEGGTKRSAQGKRLAIPFNYRQGSVPGVAFGVRRTKRDLVANSQKPRNLKKAFVMQGQHGDLLATYTGRGKNRVLQILYALEQQAKIKKRLGFEETARKVLREAWRKNFDDALDYALRTSRLK